VNQLISHPGYLSPFNSWILLFKNGRQLLSGFTNNLEVSDNCILNKRVVYKIIFSKLMRIISYFDNALSDMTDVE